MVEKAKKQTLALGPGHSASRPTRPTNLFPSARREANRRAKRGPGEPRCIQITFARRGRYPAAPLHRLGLRGRRDVDLRFAPFQNKLRNLQVALDLEVISRSNELVYRVDAVLTGDIPTGEEKLEV
jgi:hypothetical protein